MEIDFNKSDSQLSNKSNKSSELSDWDTISHEEIQDTLPDIKLTRASSEVNTIHIKHKKHIKTISEKINNYIKHTIKEITYENFTFVLQMIMKELDRTGIYGADKKHLAKLIAVYVIDCNGFPHVISYYTVEMIDGLIEFIYIHSFHKYTKKKKNCLCF